VTRQLREELGRKLVKTMRQERLVTTDDEYLGIVGNGEIWVYVPLKLKNVPLTVDWQVQLAAVAGGGLHEDASPESALTVLFMISTWT
jgi:hypothetical protein